MAATSEPKSGSVTATAFMTSPEARRGQPRLLLLVGAARHQGAAQDLGTGDQRPPAPSDPHDSSSVATTMPM